MAGKEGSKTHSSRRISTKAGLEHRKDSIGPRSVDEHAATL